MKTWGCMTWALNLNMSTKMQNTLIWKRCLGPGVLDFSLNNTWSWKNSINTLFLQPTCVFSVNKVKFVFYLMKLKLLLKYKLNAKYACHSRDTEASPAFTFTRLFQYYLIANPASIMYENIVTNLWEGKTVLGRNARSSKGV